MKPHKHHSIEKVRTRSESNGSNEEIEEQTDSPPKNQNPIISGAQTKVSFVISYA